MAFGKKKATPSVKPEPVKPAPVEDVLSVLKDIRDKLPSKENQIFASVLSGVISRQGAMDSEGQPAIALAEAARAFADKLGEK